MGIYIKETRFDPHRGYFNRYTFAPMMSNPLKFTIFAPEKFDSN